MTNGSTVKYILRHGVALAVRISSNGHLVTEREGSLIAKAGTKWPKIHSNEAAVEKTQRQISKRCNHEWVLIEHDERKCRHCGQIEIIPDL